MTLQKGSPTVVPLTLRASVLAPIRGALSAMGLMAAILFGLGATTALLAWAVGAGLMVIILAGDPRGRHRPGPQPLPGGATQESWTEVARKDVWPSTVAVSAFTAVALFVDRVLAAVLAGVLGGMAVMTLASWAQVLWLERRHGGRLYVERGGRRLFVSRPDP